MLWRFWMYRVTREQIKELELNLLNFNYYQDEIEMLKDEIAELEAADGVGAVRFDQVPGGSGTFNNSKVEKVVLMKEKKIAFLNRKLDYLLEQQERIKDSIDMLEKKEQILIKARYIDRHGEDRCRRATGITSGQYKKLIIQNELLEKLGRYYYAPEYLGREWAALDQVEQMQKELEQLQEV